MTHEYAPPIFNTYDEAIPAMNVTTQLVDTWEQWTALSQDWNALLGKSVHTSVFLTYEYLSNGWKHFHSDRSKPFILTIHDQQGQLIGIAPFRQITRKSTLFSYRVLKFACTWEMDKPYIIAAPEYETTCWQSICQYLTQNSHQWDELDLTEIATHLKAKQVITQEFANPPFSVAINEGETGVWINLEKSWEELKRGHKNFNNKLNKLKKLPNGYEIVRCTTPEDVAQAVDAFTAIEASSWKDAKMGISKDKNHLEFYKDTFIGLAKNNNICIHLLKTGDEVIAGDISYPIGDNVFFQHTVYDNKYRKISPGKLLVRLVIKSYLESNAKHGDFLCGFSGYLGSWGDGTIETEEISVIKPSLNTKLFKLSTKLFNYKYAA